MKYIGITIGPIYKTILEAEKTREIWASSYLFSLISKKLIELIRENEINPEAFIIPYVGNTEPEKENLFGAGIWPDRIIFESEKISLDSLKGIIKTLIEFFVKKNIGLSENFLENYLQVYSVEMDIKSSDNSIQVIYPILETLDQRQKPLSNKFVNDVKKFFGNIKGDNFLYQTAFPGSNKRFESIVEISTRGLKSKDESKYNELIRKHCQTDENDELINELKSEFREYFKTAYKYIAIVKCDGDNIGAHLNQIGNDDQKRSEFTKKIIEFSINTSEKINNYGGIPVYIGGEDLLFFAPVVTGKQNIINLLNEIDLTFEHMTKRTMSFGVSISYWKFPLKESLIDAESLLKKAKVKGKNRIAIKIRKHGGKIFELLINKDSKFKDKYYEFINEFSSRKNYLTSMISFFERYSEIITAILSRDDGKANSRIKNFFQNSMNEEIHSTYKNFINKSVDLFLGMSHENGNEEEGRDKFYSALRIHHFLNREDTDEF